MGCVSHKHKNQELHRQQLYQTQHIFGPMTLETDRVVQISKQQPKQQIQEVNVNEIQIIDYSQSFLKIIEKVLRFPEPLNLRKLVQRKRRNIKMFQEYYLKNESLYNWLNSQIQEEQLTLAQLKDYSSEHKVAFDNLLFLSNEFGVTIIEVILEYQEDYEILQDLLINYKIHDTLIKYLSIPLFKKISKIKDKQVNQTIKFGKILDEKNIFHQFFSNNQSLYKQECIIDAFDNMVSQLKVNKKVNLKLIKLFSQIKLRILKNSDLLTEYNIIKREQIFSQLKVPKKITKNTEENTDQQHDLESKIILNHLGINIFHQLALNKEWNKLLAQCNSYYFASDQSEITPFMLIFKYAPFKNVNQFIIKYPTSLEQGIKHQTKGGQNLIHCLCVNKYLSNGADLDCQQVMNKILVSDQLETLLNTQYNEQIPLIYYLKKHKRLDQEIIKFLSKFLVKDFNFAKLDIYASIFGEELIQKRKIIKYQTLQDEKFKLKRIRNDKKGEGSLKSINISHEILKEFDQLYHHFIQLQKLSFKHPQLIKLFPHLNQYFIFTSFFPYDMATQHETFYNLICRYLSDERVSQLLNLIDISKIIQQYQQSIQQFKIDLPDDYSVECQILAKILAIKKDLKILEDHKFLNEQVLAILKINPGLLFNKVYGQCSVKYLNFQSSLYFLILASNDIDLLQQALKLAHGYFAQKQNLDHLNQQLILHHLQFQSNNSRKEKIENFINQFPLKLNEQFEKFEQFNGAKEIPNLQLDQCYKIFLCMNFRNLDHYLNNPLKLANLIFSGNQITKLMIIHFKQFINNNIDFFLPRLWACSLGSDEDILNHLNLGQSKILTIQFLFFDQFKRFFKWQQKGAEFQVINFEKRMQQFDFETKLTYIQLFHKLDFFMTLGLDDSLHQKLQEYYSLNTKKIDKIQYTKLPLHLMLKNQAYENINYFIKIFQLNRPSLISILVENYFNQPNTFIIDGWEIQKNVKYFNQQVLEILQMNVEDNDDSEKILVPLIMYICYLEYDVFIQIDQTLRRKLYVKNIFQSIASLKLFDYQGNIKSYFNIALHSQEECKKIQKVFFLDFIQDVNQEAEGKPILEIMSDFLSQAMQENEEFSEYILENLTQQDLSFSKKFHFCNIFLDFYQQNNDRFEDYFHKIDVNQNQFFQIYCYALSKNNVQALNILLHYLEKQEYKQNFKQVYNYFQRKHSVEFQNYFRALNQKYYIVLSTEQYITMLNQLTIDVEDQITYLKMFILLGFHEKLLALLFFVDENLNIDEVLVALIYRKRMYLQQIYQFELSYLNKNLDEKVTNLQEWFKKITQQNLSKYCSFSSDCNSFENCWQNVNHQSAFDIMDQYLQEQNIQNELIEVNEYFSLLLNPKPQTISSSSIMIDQLVTVFSSKKSVISADFFKVRQESYIELFNSNEKQSGIKFELTKPHANSFKFIENLLVKIVQKQVNLKYSTSIDVAKFTQYILQYGFQREELKEFVQEGAKKYQIQNFNKTTQFYFKLNVNLLPLKTYDFSKHGFFQYRFIAIKDVTKMNDLNLSLLTQIEVFLCKGKLDHLKTQDLKFSNQNLQAALISNNFESIITIINLHPNPTQLIQQVNIFQTLIQFQNDKNVQYFYNKFLINKQKEFYKQILINKEQILYYIIFQNKQQIFENAFFPCMCQYYGEQQTKEILEYEIQKQTVDNIKLYQLVFIQKAFFMLEFMDGILQPDEVEFYFQNLTLNIEQAQYSTSSKFMKLKAFKNNYDDNRQLVSLMQLKSPLNPFLFKNSKKKNNKRLAKFQRQDNWRQQIFDRILQLQQVCIFKIFGFSHKIYKLLPKNYGFFKLFLKNKSDLHGALKLCKGNIQLLELYKTQYSIEKNMVKEIFLPCTQFYLLQNPSFYEQIISFPFEFFEILRISDYNLEISLLIALKLQNNSSFQTFLQKQIDMTVQPLNYISGQERIPENFLFLMLILNNIFNITFIENLDNISVELLIRANNFINKTVGKFTAQVSNFEVEFILNLLKKNIIFKDKQKFMNILNTQIFGLPIIIGLLYIKKIENLIYQLRMKLPKQIRLQINNFQVSLEDQANFQLENTYYLLPIQFLDEDFQLREQQYDKLLENIKLKLYQQHLEKHKQNFDNFIKNFPLYNLSEIPNQINVNFIPLNFFDQMSETEQFSNAQIAKPIKTVMIIQKIVKIFKGQRLKKKEKGDQKDDQQEQVQVSSNQIDQLKQSMSEFQEGGILNKMLFFKKLMVPQQNIEQNYNLNDLEAPHQAQFQTDNQEDVENTEEKQTLSNIQKLQKQVAFLKDIQPTNQKLNYKHIRSLIKKDPPVLFEFYHYVFPKTFNVQLVPLTEEEYQQQYNQKENLQFLIFKFRKYNEAFKQYLTTGQFNYEQTIVLPFYIKEEKIIYDKAHFTPYIFQKIFSKLYSSIQLISALCQSKDLEIEWRFHTISILEVILKPYSEFLEAQKLKFDIITLVNAFCRWKNLQLILNQIINYNIKSFSKINSIFKKISVEFIASNEKFPDQVTYKKYQILDNLFFFGQTNYILHKQILIIRISIGKNELQNPPQIQPEHLKEQKFYSRLFQNPDESLEKYQVNIIDETDFLFQIFTPEKLILFLFKKTKFDSKFQEFSRHLKEIYNKIIVFTVNYQDLLNIFVPRIMSLLEFGERSTYQQRTIKYQLQFIRKYFQRNCFQTFIETITNSTFTQSFFTQLSVLMQSLRQNNSFYLQIQKNERKLVKGHKSKVIERICNFSQKTVLPFYFGFQVSIQYFLQISKQSDICLVISKQQNGLAQVNPYQYVGCVDNYLKFYHLEAGGEILTQAKIQDLITITDVQDDKQIKNKYEKATVDISVDEIISIIVFEKFWPIDINYSEIQNVFFTDINGALIVCHEKKFLSKMNFIQNVENENEKQQILDHFFGPNLIQASFKFSVTQMIPIIPDQIIYKFRLGNSQVEEMKDKDMKTQNINLNIFDDYSTFDPLNFSQLNIASYFDENQDIQKYVKRLFKLQRKYKELQKINFFVKFDNKLNHKPAMHLDLFFQNQIIFEEFVDGLELFLNGMEQPLIENSLSLLFDYPSITSLKLAFINSIIKSVEFYFGQSNQEGSIELKQGNLQLISNSNGQKIQMLFCSQISKYLFQLILNLQDQSIKQYHLKNQNFEIYISDSMKQEDEENVGILLLIINLLYKLIYQQEEKKFQFKLINHVESKKLQHESFYAFNKRNKIIFINFQLFQDFSLSKFFIDYLNDQSNNQQQKTIPASNLYLFENQIILNKTTLQLEDLFKGLELSEEQEIQLSKNCGPKQVIDDKLEPRQFTNAFLVLKNKGYCIDILSVKSAANYWPLIQFYNQKSGITNFGQTFFFLIYGVDQYSNMSQQLSKIDVQMMLKNKQVTRSLNKFIKHKRHITFTPKMITNNIMIMSVQTTRIKKITITSNYDQLKIKLHKTDLFDSKKVIFFNQQETNKKITLNHVAVLIEENKKVEFKAIKFQKFLIQNMLSSNEKLWRIVRKGIINSERQNSSNKNITNYNIAEILNQNTISLINDELKNQFTKCGQSRIDIFEYGSNLDKTLVDSCNPLFIHSQFQQIKLSPIIYKEIYGIKLQWNPIIKGFYKLYFDDQQVEGNFIILADDVNIEKSEIIFPNPTKQITLYRELTFIVKMRDYYNNIFGDIEYRQSHCDIEVQTKQRNSQATIEKQQPTKQGLVTIVVCFLPFQRIEHKAEEVEIEITVQKVLKKSFKFQLKGIGLENRISQFQKALNAPLVRKKIKVDRFNFLQDLEKLCEYHFKSPLQIEFKNERASDYGGPRREFYNKIGELIKNSKYGFFIKHPERDTYFFNDAFKQIAKVQQDNWALLFGKLIANSILNREIIGVKFCEQLWKILFDEKITFGDLEGILEKNTIQNYKLMLTYDEETINSFGFNFTTIENNKDVDLIPNGSKILVTKENIELYLEKLTEYSIINKYKKIIENFKKGFTKVIDIKKIKEWLSTNEMHTLTQGANEIKPSELLELVKFENAEDQLISFFQIYVNDMDQNKIKKLLQFMTGSPFLPWNKQVQLTVEFTTTMNITALPRTETCFYKLVIPHYKSFDVFQQKVDIVLTHGLEGFGMA